MGSGLTVRRHREAGAALAGNAVCSVAGCDVRASRSPQQANRLMNTVVRDHVGSPLVPRYARMRALRDQLARSAPAHVVKPARLLTVRTVHVSWGFLSNPAVSERGGRV